MAADAVRPSHLFSVAFSPARLQSALGICRAFMQKLTINKTSLLRVLFGVYLFPLSLVCFSLSVPPADLPLCGLMFVLAAFGLVLARQESRGWRVIWTGALIVSILCGVLEIVAGQRIARQRSKHDLSMRLTINHALQRTRPSRRGCNRKPPWAGWLRLGRSAQTI